MTGLVPPTAAASDPTPPLPGQASRPANFLDALAGTQGSSVPLEIVDVATCARCQERPAITRRGHCASCDELLADFRQDASAEL